MALTIDNSRSPEQKAATSLWRRDASPNRSIAVSPSAPTSDRSLSPQEDLTALNKDNVALGSVVFVKKGGPLKCAKPGCMCRERFDWANKNASNHPAVVCKIFKENSQWMAYIAMLSTSIRKSYGPAPECWSMDTSKNGDELLAITAKVSLEDYSCMPDRGSSSIVVEHYYSVPLSQMHPHGSQKHGNFRSRLDEASYDRLTEKLGLSHDRGIWHQSNDLRKGEIDSSFKEALPTPPPSPIKKMPPPAVGFTFLGSLQKPQTSTTRRMVEKKAKTTVVEIFGDKTCAEVQDHISSVTSWVSVC